MQIVYFDEVKPDLNAGRSDYLIAGLCVSMDQVAELEDAVQELSQQIFGKTELSKETEFHAKHISHGKGNFKAVNIDDRLNVLFRLVEILSGEAPKRIFARINTPKLFNQTSAEAFAFQHFVERVDLCCRATGRCILIADLDDDSREKMISDFQRYRTHGTPTRWGVTLTSVVDTVHFAKSHHSRMIQLADVYNFCLTHHHRDNEKYPVAKFSELMATLDLFPSRYKNWPV